MPDDIKELPLGQQDQLLRNDPELHALLAGTANAELELAAISNELAEQVASPEQRQEQAKAARVAEILALNPGGEPGRYLEDGSYQEPKPANLSLMAELASLDKAAFEAQELIRKPPAAAPDAQQQAAQRQAQAEAHAQSLNHAASLAQRGVG